MGYLQNVKTSLIVCDYNKHKIISFSEKKKSKEKAGRGGGGTDGTDRDALHYTQLIFSESTRLTEKIFCFHISFPKRTFLIWKE